MAKEALIILSTLVHAQTSTLIQTFAALLVAARNYSMFHVQVYVLTQQRCAWLILASQSCVHQAESDSKLCIIVTENLVNIYHVGYFFVGKACVTIRGN